MVVIQVKTSDADSFLYETTCDTSNDTLIRDIVQVWNTRIVLSQLAGGIRELAMYGPMKHPEKFGLDAIQEEDGIHIEKSANYQSDPSGLRTGNGPGKQLSETMEKVAMDAESILSKDSVQRKQSVSMPQLQEKLDNIRGAVMMAYPMGLPEWDTIRRTIEGTDGLEGTSAGQNILDPATAELWVASRIFDRSQSVGDRLGKNEKTKVIGKLQKAGGGAPGREPAVSESEKNAMMAHYFKQQEEQKRLAENSEDDYLHSSWADPKQLQRSLRGQSGAVKAPGVR